MTNDQTKRLLLKVIEERNTRARKAFYEAMTTGASMIFEVTNIQPMVDAPGLAPGLIFPLDFVRGPNSRHERRTR